MQELPKDVKAEQELLGTIMANNNKINDIIGYITPQDFYTTPHQIIYTKILELYTKDIPIDVVILANELKDKLKAIGGITYLVELNGAGMKSNNIKAYAEIIKDHSFRRNIIQTCNKASQAAYESKLKPTDIVDKIESSFLNVSQNEQEGTVRLDELMNSVLTTIETNYARGGDIVGIDTGFEKINKAINGYVKKDLIIIAARPSMGKTALTMNMLGRLNPNYNAAIFELEMSKEKLGIRLLAQKTLKNATELGRGQIKDTDFNLLMDKSNQLANNNNLFFNCQAGISVNQIKAECKRIKLKYGLDVLYIDHIGLIKPSNPKSSRNDQIGQITQDLKQMAKELDLCVIALSQLSRACELRADKRPMLSDLRDSGNIEQDADTIIFLYRDDYYAEREGRESEFPGTMEVIISKNRDGEIGIIKLGYKAEYQYIYENTSS